MAQADGLMGLINVPLRIAFVRSATSAEWDDTWQACDFATYFHSREWAEIWHEYTTGLLRPQPRLVSFNDGTQAILPFSTTSGFRGLVKTHYSSPEGTFGGWISGDSIELTHAELLAEYLTHRAGSLYWSTNPYDEVLSRLNISPDLYKDRDTHGIQLSRGFDDVYRMWARDDNAVIRKVNKARKMGVSIRTAASTDDWRAYYRVYEDSLRRWGTRALSRYRRDLFDVIARRKSPHFRLWLATHGDVIIAGALCVYAKRHAAYWHGAALEEYFHLRPVNLLMFEIIRHACDAGSSWFDLGPSGGVEGVRRFKKSLGAQELKCPRVVIETRWKRLVKKVESYPVLWRLVVSR